MTDMLGSRIAALRRQAGFSQSDLAQQLQVSPSAVGMYEQGRREPSLETLVHMARIFGVSLDYLATGQTQPAEEDKLQQILLDRLACADSRLDKRPTRPFSRQELAVLFAAMLMDAGNVDNIR